MANEAIGMMDGGYFVGRASLLSWLNSFLQLRYEKVEQCCTAVAHLQLMDALFPGEIPLHKVNFEANPKHSYECLQNFKILQDVFNKKHVNRVIPVDKLVLGRYQDNLEFLQWMKSFFDRNWNEHRSYDAIGRRAEAMGRKNAGKALSGVNPKKAALPLGQSPPSTQPTSHFPNPTSRSFLPTASSSTMSTAATTPLANISNTSAVSQSWDPAMEHLVQGSASFQGSSALGTSGVALNPCQPSTGEPLYGRPRVSTQHGSDASPNYCSWAQTPLQQQQQQQQQHPQALTTVDAIRARMRNVRGTTAAAAGTTSSAAPALGDLSWELKQSTDLVQQINQAKMDAYVQRKQAVFYYSKLREIEDLLTYAAFPADFPGAAAAALAERVKAVIYAETEDFVSPGGPAVGGEGGDCEMGTENTF